MARGAAVLLGAYGCEPHQLSPIDFEDKSGPDKTRSTGLLWHILWGAWWHPGFPCPAAGGLSEIKRILAAQTTSGRRPISLKYFRWICLSFHGFISFHFDTHLHTWHTFAAWLFTRFFEFSGFPVFFMFIYSIYIYIYMQIPLSAKEAVLSHFCAFTSVWLRGSPPTEWLVAERLSLKTIPPKVVCSLRSSREIESLPKLSESSAKIRLELDLSGFEMSETFESLSIIVMSVNLESLQDES